MELLKDSLTRSFLYRNQQRHISSCSPMRENSEGRRINVSLTHSLMLIPLRIVKFVPVLMKAISSKLFSFQL
jgi:hypothetical protein